jgi:hypothetical protein
VARPRPLIFLVLFRGSGVPRFRYHTETRMEVDTRWTMYISRWCCSVVIVACCCSLSHGSYEILMRVRVTKYDM